MQGYVHIVAAHVWNRQPAEAIAISESVTDWITNPLLIQNFTVAKMLNGDPEGARESARKLILSERELLEVLAHLSALDGDAETARALSEERLNRFGTNDRHSLVIAALSGDRNEANRLATLIDSRPAGHMVLLQATYYCTCGAPFDLEATPNFAAMFAESELSWPPSKPYELPLKDW